MKATRHSRIWLNLLLLVSLMLTLMPVEALRASVSEAQPVPLRLPLLMKTWATPQTPTQDPPPGWLDRITKDVARAEYEVTWQDRTPLADARAAYQATNRAQNLRAYFTQDSLHLVPRTATDPMWMLNLTVTGSGSTDVMQQVAGAKLEAAGNGVQYDRGDLVEWYVNNNSGLEQGFTLFRGPSGDGAQLVVIDMVYTGDLQARLVEEGAAVEFTAAGVRVLRYGAVHAYDATGAALPAHLELEDTHIRLIVDAADAVYPLTIDPLFTTPDWAVEGPQTDAGFGTSVSTMGDVNGDGYSDVVIGAPDFDGGETDEGKVFVYYGSAGGLSTTAGWTAEGNQAGAHLGAGVSLAGDVNGDGYGDLVVSAPDYDDAQADVGAVYVYLGSSNGLSATPDWTAVGDQASARFGGAVRLAGDVNGDGYSDIVIGAPDYDAGSADTGKAFVYQGSASGLGGTPDWTAAGDQTAAYFGAAVAGAGDVNSDGYADVIVGAPYYDNGETDEGRVFVYHGSSAGLSASANWTAEGNQAGASFGTAVSPAGDVNGDGYADIIVGAPAYDNGQTDEGRAFVYHGSATGLGASAAWTAESDQAEAHLGAAVGTVGDLTGDGYADVVVGIPEYDGGQTDEGRLYVYAGSASGLSSACVWALESDQTGARLGAAVSAAGDVDGDGWSDVIAGAPDYDGTQNNVGRAYVVRGSTLDVAGSPGWTLEANQASAHLGYFVATAGDIDGDGYADVVVGAPDYDNGQSNEGRAYVFLGAASGLNTTPHQVLEINQANAHFGVSVGTAGDVNGDGYSDLIVGADGYDNGQTDEGAAFVYYGSAGGLNSTPAWQVESNQASAEFGYWVSTAGDVNGDGYADVIVGAYTYDNGETDEGAAFVYHGSAGGLSSTPDWMAESNQANAQYGVAVNSAGDVNGDGYSDVLVGAYWYDGTYTNEGRAELFLGSANGLNSTPAWSVVGGQANAYLGDTVASAGDVNGDGYADVVVGAYGYDNGQTNEGRAYVYYGSASGLGATPDWVNESNATSANYGTAVGTAGDVNGDGYADVIIGAKFESHGQLSEGRAYLYLGGPTGLATTASWTAESNQALASFGGSAGTAGDVNGDGYADVIVGAGWYESSWLQLDEGYAALYYGNGGNGGLGARSRQRRLDDTAPIAPGGQSDGAGVQIALTGRTPLGRAAARLQWQIAPLGTPFTATTGVVVGTTPGWTALWSTGTEITQSVTGLVSGTDYHWRVRWLYAPDNVLGQPAGRWLHVPWNGWLETDFRTATVAETPISDLAAVNDGPTTLGQATTLTATVSAGSNINYTWAFGDGDTSAGASVTHTYPGVGLYTAVVTASNSANTVTATTTVTVSDVAITGLTAVNDSPTTLGQATTLTATVSAGSNVVYTWDFGDSEMGSGAGVTHTYTTADTHIAVVTATNSTNSVTTTTTVTVIPGGDTAITGLAAANDSPTTLGQATTLTATVSAGSNVSYTWAFGDGSTGSGAVVAHTYPVAENYTAVVTATNSANTVTATTGVTILPPTYMPQAAFTALPVAGYAPLTVQFSNYSVHATAYGWDFGDGFTSTALSPTHVYTTAGIYTPTLAVTGTGGTDSLVRPAYITVLTLNATPQITIVSPVEGAVIGAGVVQVTGIVSDDAPPEGGNVVTGVWVNDVAATLDGDAFTATLTLSSGTHILYAVAEDAQGAYGTDTSVVRVDGEGPMVTIHAPRNGQAVYTLAPTVNISYTDFYTEVNMNTLSVTLRDTNAVVTDVTAVFTAGASGASGSLSALATETSYTLTASISDTLGNTGAAAITFYVPQDAATLTPPATPEAPGWVSGRVYDARTCDVYLTTCEGLPGVHVTVQSIDHTTRETTDNVTGTVVTGPDGFYAFPIVASGTYALRFTKAGYTYSQREVTVIRERSTAVNAVYLTGLDTATTYLSYPITQTQVHNSADGKLRLEFPPGALASGQTVTVTATNFEHVEFLPSGELPPGTWETYAFNLGGDSEVQFTRPITVMIANARGFAPGTMIPLGYWNQTTLQWEHVGVGVVDAGGAWVVMQVEHFSNFDVNLPVSPPGFEGGIESDSENDGECCTGEDGSFIGLKSGQVREWIELPGVNVLGEMMAPTLAYNTAYAYPSAVIDTRLDLSFDPAVTTGGEYVQFELYIEGEKTENFTFAADANTSGEVGRYRLLWDGRDAQGQLVSPGVYAYAVRMSVPYEGEYYWSQTGTFGGPPDLSRPTGVTVTATQNYWDVGTVELNPQTDSALGSGWVLEDVQRLYVDDADQIVIADGSELTEYTLERPANEVVIPQYDVSPPPVTGPAAAIALLPPPATFTAVSGTLAVDTTWTSSNSPYVLNGGNVVVTDGVTLTIEPGVTVMLGEQTSLLVYGGLYAMGWVTAPITFTAYSADGIAGSVISDGYWGYVQIGGGADTEDSDGSLLRHVVLEAGGVDFNPSLYITQSAPALENLIVRGSGGDGIAIADSPGATLITVTMESNAGDGVQITGGQGDHTLSNVTARYNQGYGIFAQDVGVTLTVQNSLIAVSGVAARLPLTAISQDNVWQDNQRNHIEWQGGTLNVSRTWDDAIDAYVVVEDDIVVDAAAMLTLAPGTTVLFDGYLWLNVKGNLQAEGTAAAPIYFGSLHPEEFEDDALWEGITLGDYTVPGDCDGSRLRYATIAHANGGVYVNSCAPTLEYLTLFKNNTGIELYNADGTTIAHSNFVEHIYSWGGIYFGWATNAGSQNVTIRDSNFLGMNEDYNSIAIENSSSCDGLVIHNSNFIHQWGLHIDCQATISGNYWGSPSGPNVNWSGQPGDGAIIDIDTDVTTYEPWLTSPAINDAAMGNVIVNRTATDHTTLTYDESSGTYTRFYPDGRIVHFDAQGYHDYTLLPGGRKTVYSYTVDGALSAMGIITPGGSTPVWTWDFTYQDGKLSRITDPAGRATGFTVDEHNHLTQVTFPDASTRQFYYNERGLLTQQVDPAGQVSEYVYDGYGRLTAHTTPPTTVYDPATGQTTMEQGVRAFAPSDVAQLINGTPASSPANPASAVPTSTLLVDSVTYADGSTRSGHTNAWGQWTDQTDALGRTTVYTRDVSNNLTGLVQPEGDCIVATYDDAGRPTYAARMGAEQCALSPEQRDPAQLQSTTFTYEARYGQVKTQTDALSQTTVYTYDYELDLGDAGKLVQIAYPQVQDEAGVWHTPVVSYTYNALGLLAEETARDSTVTRYTYTQGTPDELHGGANAVFAAGVITPVPGLRAQVVRISGDTVVTTTYTGFDAQGHALTTIAPDSSATHSLYDVMGRVISTTSAVGVTALRTYDTAGRLVTTTVQRPDDPITVVTEYVYDAEGRQIATRTTAGAHVVENRTYYDANGRRVAEEDALGRVTRTIYDAAGQLLYTVDPLGQPSGTTAYDLNGRQTWITDTAGSVTYNEYDAYGQLARSVQNWEDGVFDPAAPDRDLETRYQYDQMGRALIVTDTVGSMTRTWYDDAGRTLGSIAHWDGATTLAECATLPATRAANLCTQYAYDAVGRTIIVTDTVGTMARTFYDVAGRVTARVENWNPATLQSPDQCVLSAANIGVENICTRYGYDQLGRQITTTNALGQTSLTVYDAYGRAFLSVANWNGTPITGADDCAFPPAQPDTNLCTVTEYDYDRRSATLNALGNRTEFGYDALGRVVTTTRYLGLLPVTTVIHYNLLGQRVGQTDARGNTATFIYDALGRQIETVTPEGLITRQYYDVAGRVEKVQDAGGKITAYEYDALGRRIAVSDPLSQTTRFAYDALGAQTAITDANGIVTAYAYDALNRLSAVTENQRMGESANYETNVVTQYAYDVLGNRTVITNARAYTQSFTTYDILGRPVIVEDALGNRTYTAYDALGRRTVVTDADGLVTHYLYDGLNRLLEIQYPDATVEYAYDALGRRTAMTDTAGVTTYQYDDLGRVIRVTDPFTGVVEYGYDLAGNRTALTVTHNAQPTTTHYAFDADNRLIQVTDWATGTTTYAYDPAGRLSTVTLPNGVVTAHGYDAIGRLTSLTHTKDGMVLSSYHYVLDDVGNRTCVTETVNGVTRVIAYTYDGLYRLTEADYSTGENYTYVYDAVGNREVMTNATGIYTYTYDAANRLTSIEHPALSFQTYSWDDRGNLIHDGVYTYTYNAAGRMVQAQNLTATLVYTYNADGLRVARSQSVASVQSVDTFTWEWATGVPELLSDGESLYLIGYDTLGWDDGNDWTFVLPDALGSVRQETDAAGAVTAVREWSPYGEELGGAQNGLGYTGEWFDANVGLTYLRARWYDVETGRFTQRDPVATSTFYRYASNNPINWVDPTGYFSEDLIQRSVYPASIAELAASFSPDPALEWGQLAVPYDSPDAIYYYDSLVRPEFSGLLWLLKHAGHGDRLRSGRLVRKGWNLEIEWTPEWTLAKPDGCASSNELFLTRERGWLGNLIFGPHTKLLRDYVNDLASQNSILGGYVFHELRGTWGNDKVIDGYSPVPDLLTVDIGLSAPVGDVGGMASISVDRYGTKYESGGGSYGLGLPVNADVGAVYVGDHYLSLVDVMHRKESKASPEQISAFWRGWSTGASVQMFRGGGWLLADNGTAGTIFTSGVLSIGVGGSRGFTEYKQELFTSGWDTLNEGFRAISWEDALLEPAYPDAGE